MGVFPIGKVGNYTIRFWHTLSLYRRGIPMIYLDYSANTPADPAVLDAYVAA